MSKKKNIFHKNKRDNKFLNKKKIFSRYEILYKIVSLQSKELDTKDLEYILYQIEESDKITRRYTKEIELDKPIIKKYFYKEDAVF